LKDEAHRPPELYHLRLDQYLHSVKDLDVLAVNDSSVLLRDALHGSFNNKQSLNSVLLNHNIDTTLSDSHYNGCLETVSGARQTLEVEVSVELYTSLGRESGHPVFAIHLVALLCHLKFVNHIVRETLDIQTGR
jgi:hypothetical protein